MRGQSRRPRARNRSKDRSKDRSGGSGGGCLRTYGDLQAGWASTFAGALEVSREAIIEAVGGPDATETFICLGGNRSSGGKRSSGSKRSSGGNRPADASERTPDRTPGGTSGGSTGGSTVESTGRTEPEERDLASADRVFIAVTEGQFEALAERVGTEVSVE
jgi:hypothetical protein